MIFVVGLLGERNGLSSSVLVVPGAAGEVLLG